MLRASLFALLAVALAAGCATQTQQSSAPDTSINGSGNLTNSTNETPTQPTLPGFNTTAGSGETPVVTPAVGP